MTEGVGPFAGGSSEQEDDQVVVDRFKLKIDQALAALEHIFQGIQKFPRSLEGIGLGFTPGVTLPRLSTGLSGLKAGEGYEDNDFLDNCGVFCDIVGLALTIQDVPILRVETVSHTSLIVVGEGRPIRVDPTIGQFVGDHSQIFVGTEEALVKLIGDSYNQGKLVNMGYFSSADKGVLSPNFSPEEMLRKFWGI